MHESKIVEGMEICDLLAKHLAMFKLPNVRTNGLNIIQLKLQVEKWTVEY